jgi:two-component system, chemotaxis family, protein-glutamate methylesterase/glutaminase
MEQIAALKPDVVTLDLMMPHLDGVGVLRALRTLYVPGEPAPRVVVVSMSDSESALGAEALEAGALSIVAKPTALATAQLYDLKDALVSAVHEAALVRSGPLAPRESRPPLPPLRASAATCKLVVIGTSTGGPQALAQLMAALPQDFPVPVAMVLHIPEGYTEELAKRLDRNSAITVQEAKQGLILQPGGAVLARGGMHLTLAASRGVLSAQLALQPLEELHCPSVDVLFESAAACLGGAVLGVVLTGMGSDGLRGARAIHAAGGKVLTEAEESCVVYGMPGVVKAAGLSHEEAPLEEMAALIVRHL